MPGSIDTSNSVSVLNNAASLLSNRQKLQNNKDKKITTEKNKKPKTFFETILETKTPVIEETDYEKQIQGLVGEEKKQAISDIMAILQDKVYSSGANLSESINPQTIVEYKNAVKSFVKFALKHSLKTRKMTSGSRFMDIKQKEYYLVKVIDEKLEQLTKELLMNQVEKLEILDRLGEIKGLLVDLST